MFRYISIISLLVFFLPTVVTAVTLIEIDSKKDGNSQVFIGDDKVRVNIDQDQSYMLIDYKKQTMYMVLPQQKQIMDLNGDMPNMSGKPAPNVKVSMIPMGKGPDIAGYSTKKFSVKANGKNCGTVFGSIEAMKVTGIDKFLSTMDKFQEKQLASMGSIAAMMGPCDRARMSMSSHAKTVGLSLREIDRNGKVDNEVVRIDTNASMPANAFNLPKGYEKTSVADQMKQAQKGMSEMSKHQPDMEQMMKQMQQSGGMPPEALEQMKRYQEMMKQQQK